MKKNNRTRVGSEAQYGPRLAGEILKDYLKKSNEPFARAYREHTSEVEAEEQGWHANTDLGCDLKTILRSGHMMTTGKEIPGVLRRDSDAVVDEFLSLDAHYTFIETQPVTAGKRNLHVFDGKFITVTRRDDGSLRPNFKPMKVGKDFSVYRYALGVYNELCMALGGLVGEEWEK